MQGSPIHTQPHVFSNLSFLLFTVAYLQYFTALGDRMILYHHRKSISVLCFSKFPSQGRFCTIVLSLDFLHLIYSSACRALDPEMHIAPSLSCKCKQPRHATQAPMLGARPDVKCRVYFGNGALDELLVASKS